jgi:hypothetical protein
MNDAEKVIWTAFGALMVALVGGAIRYLTKHLADRRADRVVLDSKLNISVGTNTIQRIGCPGILLSITCKSKRPAKIKSAHFSVSLTPEDLASFETGFQSPFGQSRNAALPPPRLQIPLFPASKPTNENGFILERDDVASFFFPIAVPVLPLFLKAPSEDVQVAATFFDGSNQVLGQGLLVQEMLRDVLEASGSLPMQLKVPMSMNITVSAEKLPDTGAIIGKLNPKAIRFHKPQEAMIEAEFTEERMAKCTSIFREIWNNWSQSKTLQYVVVPSQKIDTDNPSKAIGATFQIGVAEPVHTIGLVDLLVVFSILSQQTAAAKTIDTKHHSSFSVRTEITTQFSSPQASSLLKQISMREPAGSV